MRTTLVRATLVRLTLIRLELVEIISVLHLSQQSRDEYQMVLQCQLHERDIDHLRKDIEC